MWVFSHTDVLKYHIVFNKHPSVSYIYIDMVNENCEKHTPPTSTSIFFRVNTIF